jgi:hypothetical protein
MVQRFVNPPHRILNLHSPFHAYLVFCRSLTISRSSVPLNISSNDVLEVPACRRHRCSVRGSRRSRTVLDPAYGAQYSHFRPEIEPNQRPEAFETGGIDVHFPGAYGRHRGGCRRSYGDGGRCRAYAQDCLGSAIARVGLNLVQCRCPLDDRGCGNPVSEIYYVREGTIDAHFSVLGSPRLVLPLTDGLGSVNQVLSALLSYIVSILRTVSKGEYGLTNVNATTVALHPRMRCSSSHGYRPKSGRHRCYLGAICGSSGLLARVIDPRWHS